MSFLYRYTYDTAVRNGELDQWYRSQGLNIACKKAMDIYLLHMTFWGISEPKSCRRFMKELTEEYGIDRVMHVLANTVQQRRGAFEKDMQKWADGFYISKEAARTEYVLQTENIPGICVLLSQARKQYEALGLLDHTACETGSLDYEKQILVLKPQVLSDKYKSSAYQLFYADIGGFGCSPSARGRKVMGHFLKDGEQATFYRDDFLGIAKEEVLPQWAVEQKRQLDTGIPDLQML